MQAPITSARLLDAVTGWLEHATELDAPADAVARLADAALPNGRLRDAGTGTPIGHPLHPVLVTVPIGSWVAATVLDLTRGDARAARRLVGLGVAAAIPAALTGTADWLSTAQAERRVGLVHALLNDAGLGLFTASWLARRRGRRLRGALWSAAGLSVAGAAGWLGGHLAYAQGVGVDTTAFEHMPTEWTDVAAAAELLDGTLVRADAAGVPVLLAEVGGDIRAFADRCPHRGGPLHEGERAGDTVTCPWHGSAYSLVDGAVQHGPSTRPAAAFEVRTVDGRVQVRRDEPRALRTRPVGP